jgi:hypothetical protein
MPVSLAIDPPDFVLPPGPVFVVVRVDRDAFQHFDPDMDPLAASDGFVRIFKKGKTALDNIRRELSIKLWAADLPCAAGVKTSSASSGGGRHRYLGFWFIHGIPPGDFRPAVVELTSDPAPVDNCIRFYATEPDENHKAGYRERYKGYYINQKAELPPGGEGS